MPRWLTAAARKRVGRRTPFHIGAASDAAIEYAFSGNWSVKVEYLFVQLQNASYFAAPIVTPAGTVLTRGNVPLNNNIVRAGLNYKF